MVATTECLTFYDCKLLEGIWNNYIDVQQKYTQVRFIMILCARGYNSPKLSELALQSLNTNMFKYKPIRIGQPHDTWSAKTGQIIHFCISSLLILFFLQYNHKPSTVINY